MNPPLCRFRVGSVNIFIYNMCFFQQTITHMRKRFTEWGHCVGHQWSYDHIHEYMNIMRVDIECFTGCKRINQRRISFVPGYLHMILWNISTAISIKHRILATFNIKKTHLFERLYSFNMFIEQYSTVTSTNLFEFNGIYQQYDIKHKFKTIYYWRLIYTTLL